MLTKAAQRCAVKRGLRCFSSGSGRVLVVGEHDGNTLNDATLSSISAASQLGEVTVLLAGTGAGSVGEQVSKVQGVSQVLTSESAAYDHGVAENISPLVLKAQEEGSYTHILTQTTSFGKNFLPRVAASLDVQPIADVLSVESEDTFTRPTYAGNAVATVQSSDSVKLMTVRNTSFAKAEVGGDAAPCAQLDAPESTSTVEWVKDELQKSDRPELSSASVVVSGGRGLKSGENFDMLYELADKMGAAVGASRAAVDAGYVNNDLQVGQTGKVVAPDLYIAVGISGAIQHLAGMKDSKCIVAINKDPEAPIFQVADYSLEADLFKAVPEFTSLLE